MTEPQPLPKLSMNGIKKYMGKYDMVLVGTASWCGYCTKFKPVLSDMWDNIRDRKDVIVAYFDAHEHQKELEIGEEIYGVSLNKVIQSYPTVMFLGKATDGENAEAVVYQGKRDSAETIKSAALKFFKKEE